MSDNSAKPKPKSRKISFRTDQDIGELVSRWQRRGLNVSRELNSLLREALRPRLARRP